MNANQTKLKQAQTKREEPSTTYLRVLSSSQRKKVAGMKKDWRNFTDTLFGEMFDKI